MKFVAVLCQCMAGYRVAQAIYLVGDHVSYCKVICLWVNCINSLPLHVVMY